MWLRYCSSEAPPSVEGTHANDDPAALHEVDGGHVSELNPPLSQVMSSPPSGEHPGTHCGLTSEPLEPELTEPQSSAQPDSHPVAASAATMAALEMASNASRLMGAPS
jgi:hypothetical protein